MFKHILPLSLITLTLASLSAWAAPIPAGEPPQDDFALIISRYRDVLLRDKPPAVEQVQSWIVALGADGRWPNIDYTDKQPAGWKTSDHLTRLKHMSRALVDPQSPSHDDAALSAAIMRGLDDWIAHRYKNPNWWHNEIGVPMLMRDIIVLLGDRLDGDRRKGALEVLHQYGHFGPGNGANLMWTAELALEYGALTNDAALIAQNSKLISDEIHVSTGEGIQSDWSYHQHGARLQQFHYGGAFINDAARLGWQLSGTPWAIPPEKLQLVADCLLQGGQWMRRNTSTVPGTLDRSVSRPGTMNSNQSEALNFLRASLPQRSAEIDTFLARQNGQGQPLVGFRAFPRSDFTTYHRPAFSFFLKTISDRTLATESINGENLKGHLLNSGDHYLLRDGQEYLNLPPVWDWDLLPGVTFAKGAGSTLRQPFVGTVSNGIGDATQGATAMDYQIGDKTGALISARKFWACEGDIVVCLIGDLRASIDAPVRTALDQCLLRGPVTVADAGGTMTVVPEGTHDLPNVRWIQHAGFAYFPLTGAAMTLQTGPMTGNWASINKGGAPDMVTQSVFLPILEHGTRPDGQASGFVIAPCVTTAQAAAIAAAPSFQVLRNDASCQAVRFTDGTLMASFYEAGALKDGERQLLAADQPCLVLTNPNGTWACDPTQKGERVTITVVNGQAVPIELPAGGLTVKAR